MSASGRRRGRSSLRRLESSYALDPRELVRGSGAPDRSAPVLVGVDGSPGSWEALEWAAAEAAGRRVGLEVRHAVGLRATHDPCGLALMDPDVGFELAGRVLAESVERAHAIEPSITISTSMWTGLPVDVLGEISEAGQPLVVLGRPEKVRWSDAVLGTAVELLARRVPVPVGLVRLARNRVVGPSAGRVVLAAEGPGSQLASAMFALRSARQRGVGLTVVRSGGRPFHARTLAWMRGLTPWALDPRIHPTLTAPTDPTFELVSSLGRSFPEVEIRYGPRRGRLSKALVAEAQGAALVVLGIRRGNVARRLISRSAVWRLCREMPAPLVVIMSRESRTRSGQ